MSSFWKQSREIIVVIGMAGLLAVLVYFGIIRIMKNNRDKMELIQQAIVDRKMLEEQSQGIASMRDTWERIQSAGGKLDVFLPKDQIVSLVESLEAIGKELHVTVVSEASPTPLLTVSPTKKKGVKGSSSEESDTTGADAPEEKAAQDALVSLLPEDRSIFVTFKVTGTYDHVLAFLQKLDTMPTLLDVLSLEISPAPTEDESKSISIASPRVVSNPFSVNTVPAVSTEPSGNADSVPQGPPEVLASFSTVIYTNP